jgi:hypothetical protein
MKMGLSAWFARDLLVESPLPSLLLLLQKLHKNQWKCHTTDLL